MNPEISFPIEQSYINLSIVETKEQQEKEKKLGVSDRSDAIMGTFEEIYGTKSSIDIKNIFDSCRNSHKKVLVLGRAGIGKSTFCKYAAYQWAKGEIWSQYDLVLVIRLHTLTESRYPSGTKYYPIDIVKREDIFLHPLSKTDESNLSSQLGSHKVLWLLDGYDEIAGNLPPHLEDLLKVLCDKEDHILTSRPYAATLPYDVKMEITGFTDNNISKYVAQFFDLINSRSIDTSFESQKLLNFLKTNPSIWGVAHIPVNLSLISNLWSDADLQETQMLTVTALYDRMTEWLCRRYLTKQNIKTDQIRKKVVYEQCQKELEFLETLAFHAMESNTIIIRSSLLQKAEEETQCVLENYPQLLNIGILKAIDSKSSRRRIQTEMDHYFVHLSFQEHFAARYLVKTLTRPSQKKAIDFIKNYKYNQRFTLVFAFASGLLEQSNCPQAIDAFWSSIESEPRDLIGLRHTQLIVACIDEVNDRLRMPQVTRLFPLIRRWVDLCISHTYPSITDHLTQSFRRTATLLNEPFIQETFIQLLQNKSDQTKLNALRMISEIPILNPQSELILQLSATLDHSDFDVRRTACEALGKLGEKATSDVVINGLIKALADSDEYVRRRACDALGKLGEKAASDVAINGLIKALADSDRDVRETACEALGELGEKAASDVAINGLIKAIVDSEILVRRKAYEALVKLCEKAGSDEVFKMVLEQVRLQISVKGDYEAWELLKIVLSLRSVIDRMNSHEVCELCTRIRQSRQLDCRDILCDQFIRFFLQTEISAWLSIGAYVMFLQGNAVTLLQDRVAIYGCHGVIEIPVRSEKLIEEIRICFDDEMKKCQK